MAKEVKWTESQKAAIGSFGKNTLVSASAGSGKTSLMMEKIARMVSNKDFKGLKDPMDIKKMMIVTFTKEVARELRVKVQNKLVKCIYKYPDEAKRLIEQIEDIAIASISTIDSLCSNIVRMYFHEAGVDPAFSVMEQEEADLYFSRAVTKVLQNKDLESSASYITLSTFIGRDLSKVIKSGYNAVRNKPNYREYLKTSALEVYDDFESSLAYKDFWQRLVSEANRLIPICDEQVAKANKLENTTNGKKFVKYFQAIQGICNKVIGATSYEDLLEFPCKLSGVPKSEADMTEEERGRFDALCKEYGKAKEAIESALSDICSQTKADFIPSLKEDKELLDEYVKLLLEIDEVYNEAKLEDNKLDFNDIEQKTLLILQNPDIKSELQSKYDYLCIDEYQDINPLQDEILKSISKGDNTFMVGDVKQSIYGFRMSEPGIFLQKYKDYTKDANAGSAINLNENFRSKEEILVFVNKIFDANMTEEFGGINYAKDAELVVCDDQKSKDVPRVKIAVVKPQEKRVHSNIAEDGIYSPKSHVYEDKSKDYDAQAMYIAKKIRGMIGKKILPKEINGTVVQNARAVEYQDIAILFRARNGAKEIVKAVQKLGIPIDISNATSDSNNFATSLLVSLLSVIDNDQQDIELANTLLSVFGGFNIAELAEIRDASKSSQMPFYTAFNYYEGPNKEIYKKIENFKKMIEKYRFYSKFTPVDELLEMIIEENMFDEYILSQENGESVLAQLYTFLNALSTKAYNSSISKFISIYREYGSIDSTTESSISTANCVKCNTVHGSKGLEYPIVFLIDADHGENSEKDKIVFNRKYGFAIKRYLQEKSQAVNTFVSNLFNAYTQNTNREETMRGLYVALTRAQEYLFITGESKDEWPKPNEYKKDPKNATSYLDYLFIAASKDDKFVSTYADVLEDNTDENNNSGDDAAKEDVKADDTFIGQFNNEVIDDYPFEESTKTPIWHSVTQINKLPSQELADEDYKVVYDFEGFFGEKEVTNPGAGTAYHRVLELIDFHSIYTIADVESAIEQMVIDGLLTEEQRDMVKSQNILDCINSSLMQKAKNRKCIKEGAFKLYVPMNEVVDTTITDKILVQGTFDLFVPRSEINGESMLIDYKYSNASEKDIANTYNKQLKLYKKAIESCYGEEVDKMYIYVLGQNMQIEIVDKK